MMHEVPLSWTLSLLKRRVEERGEQNGVYSMLFLNGFSPEIGPSVKFSNSAATD